MGCKCSKCGEGIIVGNEGMILKIIRKLLGLHLHKWRWTGKTFDSIYGKVYYKKCAICGSEIGTRAHIL